MSSSTKLYQSADTHYDQGEPAVAAEHADTHAQPLAEYLARYQVCQQPRDLLHFYVGILESPARLFSCRPVRTAVLHILIPFPSTHRVLLICRHCFELLRLSSCLIISRVVL